MMVSEEYYEVLVDSTNANRPHFLLNNNVLYVVYDETNANVPTVKTMKVTITRGYPVHNLNLSPGYPCSDYFKND